MLEKLEGFSLVEVVIVTIIIGVLASIAVTRYSGAIEQGRQAEAYSVLSDIMAGERVYFAENNAYTGAITNLHNYSTVPASDNFVFSIASTDASSGYAQAARVSAGEGRWSYGMCLSSGKKGACDADNASCLSCP